jgi:homoserine kinase type II
MGLFTVLSLEDARRLGGEFGIDVARVEPLAAGSVNSNYRVTDASGNRYFARVYEEQDVSGAEVEIRLLGELHRQGIPTTRPLAHSGSSVATLQGKPFAMYPWVDGEILCQRKVEPSHCEKVGAALAKIHAASPRLSRLGEGRFGVDDVARRLDRIERESPEHAAAASVIRRKLEHHRQRRTPALPSGVIHGDLFRDNVLWHDGDIAALIDFESASHGPFCFDLAVTLLAWCYGSDLSDSLVGALFGGYAAVRPLEPEEREGIVTEGALACLRFATTRITDFSMRAEPGKPPLRDYRRFLQRLDALERGALDAPLAALAPSR